MGTPKYAQEETDLTPRETPTEMDRRPSEVAARRLPGVKRVGRLEESLYWLFSAAVLGYLLLEIIGR
jgi:hypothetical protein